MAGPIPEMDVCPFTEFYSKTKGRDLTQSYDKSPYANRNVKRSK